jgi:hypothetical protein
MKISGDFAVLLIFCCYVGIFYCCGTVNFVGLICCFVVTGLKDVSGRGKIICCFVGGFLARMKIFEDFAVMLVFFAVSVLFCWINLVFCCCWPRRSFRQGEEKKRLFRERKYR